MISFYAADGATCNLRGSAASARVEEEIVCHLHSYTDKGTGTVVVPVHIWIGTVIDTDAEPKSSVVMMVRIKDRNGVCLNVIRRRF